MSLSYDYLADYRTLGCHPGCSANQLEQAWRAALSRAHPDRAPPGKQAEAAARAQALNTAYRRLRGFAQRHGRLPGQPDGHAAAAHAGHPATASAPMPQPQRPRGRRRLALAAVLGAIALSWLIQPGSPPTAQRPAPIAKAPDAATTEGAAFSLQSHADEVLQLAGPPVLRQGDELRGEVWEYGPSFVVFRARRVVDWYSSPMRPLPVASERPVTEHGAALIAPPSRR